MQDLTIRTAQSPDVAGIATLVTSLAHERGSSTDVIALNDAILGCVGQGDHEVFVAASGDDILAYIAVHWIPFPLIGGREAYISDLVVHADARGHGIGNRMLDAVQERATALECQRLMLQNRIADESFQRDFYLKAGFSVRTDFAAFVKPLPPT